MGREYGAIDDRMAAVLRRALTPARRAPRLG